MLENIEAGDRVINSRGEEATVVSVIKYENERTRLHLETPIVGWLDRGARQSWSYENNGEFVREFNDQKASNLVKVIKHD